MPLYALSLQLQVFGLLAVPGSLGGQRLGSGRGGLPDPFFSRRDPSQRTHRGTIQTTAAGMGLPFPPPSALPMQ